MNSPAPAAGIGHNLGPTFSAAHSASERLNAMLADMPAVTSLAQAEEAGARVQVAKAAARMMEAERLARVRPLNDQVAEINATYKAPRTLIEKLVSEAEHRLTVFARAEERRRFEEAEAKRRVAEEAERVAREAEAAEREALENARLGEVGVNVGGATALADAAFSDAAQRSKEARRAERDAPVRLGGGNGARALSLRTTEILEVTDLVAAVRAMGPHPKVVEAVLSAARDHRKEWNELPPGVSARLERRI